MKEERTQKVKVVPCEVYSRVVGYYRPVTSWNDGKRREFEERKELDLGKVTILIKGGCGCGK